MAASNDTVTAYGTTTMGGTQSSKSRPGFVKVDPNKLIPDARRGYTKTQLKDIARQLGLPVGGNKEDLVGRIKGNLGIPIGQSMRPVLNESFFTPASRPPRTAPPRITALPPRVTTAPPPSIKPFSPTAPFPTLTQQPIIGTQLTSPWREKEQAIAALPVPSTSDPRIASARKQKEELINGLHTRSLQILEKKDELRMLFEDIKTRYGRNAKNTRIYQQTLSYDEDLLNLERQIEERIRFLNEIDPTDLSKYEEYKLEFRLARLLLK